MIIGVISGAIGGLFHRLVLSPFIGQQNQRSQSVGTPAAGVMVAFLAFTMTLSPQLRRVVRNPQVRQDVKTAVYGAWWTVFYSYGLIVVLTILADIGGVKKE